MMICKVFAFLYIAIKDLYKIIVMSKLFCKTTGELFMDQMCLH